MRRFRRMAIEKTSGLLSRGPLVRVQVGASQFLAYGRRVSPVSIGCLGRYGTAAHTPACYPAHGVADGLMRGHGRIRGRIPLQTTARVCSFLPSRSAVIGKRVPTASLATTPRPTEDSTMGVAARCIDVPSRSHAQRMEALERANQVRSYHAQVKRDLRVRRLRLDDVLADEQAQTMKLVDALLAVPSVGRIKAKTILRRAHISPSKTLGGLTGRQRSELVVAVRSFPSVARETIGVR